MCTPPNRRRVFEPWVQRGSFFSPPWTPTTTFISAQRSLNLLLRSSQVHHFNFSCSVSHLLSMPFPRPPAKTSVWSCVCAPCAFLTGITPPVDFEEEEIYDPDGETLTVEAKMQPLQLDSMTKSKDGFLGVGRGQTALHLSRQLDSNESASRV